MGLPYVAGTLIKVHRSSSAWGYLHQHTTKYHANEGHPLIGFVDYDPGVIFINILPITMKNSGSLNLTLETFFST